ncbi:alpha/beta fold hydrolase [Microbacterium aerolatum]|uniref:Alpha/beta hydrolase n=1 Tax=Microbacterium aerolatum TaxID=153731 RepID=A0A511AGZ9_9MICO|nr:alpha/beta hydrolase [Microbacterium aerolatum]GEK87445.1 alpha/beta hydrolase [Microbacterium aerolatum]GGB33608.1 alpha/beta hydrolase [Microbacterium aerolatum]
MTTLQIVILNVGIAAVGIIVSQAIRVLVATVRTKNYFWGPVDKARDIGFVEKQIELRPGLRINYAEGPVGGIPLLLVHGQGMTWEDYGPVLPKLASTYHVIAVDCHGHGKSSWNPEDYNVNTMANDLADLGRILFNEMRFVASGHSSGGLIVARLAALHADAVSGLVIEDAPFFSTEPHRAARTYAYIDSFNFVDDFLAQDAEPDWVCFYMPRSYWKRMFGEALWGYFTREVVSQRHADPGRLPLIRWAGISINRIWESVSHPYDVRFSKAFSDFSWFDRFDQSQTLRDIECPTTFIKATTRYDKRGNLLAALSEEDCERIGSILSDNETVHVRSSHDVHFAHPRRFASAVIKLAERI